MAYTAKTIKDLSTSTPAEGSSAIPEFNDSDREINTVLKNQYAITTLTSLTTLDESHSVVLCDGTFTVNLPSIATVSSSTFTKKYTIVNIGTGVITIGGTVNGVVNPTIATQYVGREIYGNGTVWVSEKAATFDANGRIVETINSLWDGTAGRSASPTVTANTVVVSDAAGKIDRNWFMFWTSPTQVGSGLAITEISFPAFAALNGTDVAFFETISDELRTYRFNGSTWSLVGSGLAITGAGAPALAALNSTDVAFIDSTNDSLRTYRFNGSTWSLVGSGLAITTVDLPALAALNSTDVAFIDSTNDELRTYRFNGSTWSLVGSGLAITTVDFPALAALNGTDVAFIDSANDALRTYRFNGSTWSLVGSGLAITGAGFPALAALNSTDVAFIDSTNDELRTYRFNGSTWSLVGSGLAITTGYSALAALNSTDVAFIDTVSDELRTYRFGFSIGKPFML